MQVNGQDQGEKKKGKKLPGIFHMGKEFPFLDANVATEGRREDKREDQKVGGVSFIRLKLHLVKGGGLNRR